MSITYNIYRMDYAKLDFLCDKLGLVGLIKQKEKESNGYKMTFYFSEGILGNDIWWCSTYEEFFNDGVEKPKNFFYYGLLVCFKIDDPKNVYLVSLGKSHFYLSKFIERDFGIRVAVRMADEETILLKKSRYFSGSKRQEIASYTDFVRDNYEAGESVEHLKIKASDKDVWGDKNIIFADSIQMNIDRSPIDLSKVFDDIERCLDGGEVIRLPKLEAVEDDDLIRSLDSMLLGALKNNRGEALVEEFQVFGVSFCFRFHEHSYQIYVRGSDGRHRSQKDLGNSLDVSDVREYLNDLNGDYDIGDVKVKFSIEGKGLFTRGLKELLDFHVSHNGCGYFIRGGEWFLFNEPFMVYLKRSLDGVAIERKEDLLESEYLDWVAKKKNAIENGGLVENKIFYREYYFNLKQSSDNGYELLDRQLELINSLEDKGKKYKVEVADLYKDGELLSVKISDDADSLIYNIEQSKTSLELIKQNVLEFDRELRSAAIWFVFGKDVGRITEFNSIQFLLAVESWKKRVIYHQLTPKIYISRHVKDVEDQVGE